MRLVELDPRWLADLGAPDGVKQGITFLCPCCREIRLGVWFDIPVCGSNPIDVAAYDNARRSGTAEVMDHPAYEAHMGATLWHRQGGSFDNLTLTPSIDASKFGHWHGFVTNGAIS